MQQANHPTQASTSSVPRAPILWSAGVSSGSVVMGGVGFSLLEGHQPRYIRSYDTLFGLDGQTTDGT